MHRHVPNHVDEECIDGLEAGPDLDVLAGNLSGFDGWLVPSYSRKIEAAFFLMDRDGWLWTFRESDRFLDVQLRDTNSSTTLEQISSFVVWDDVADRPSAYAWGITKCACKALLRSRKRKEQA